MHACKPKIKGELGIRGLRLVNLAFLVKWRWRLLTDALGFLCDIIVPRYGALIVSSLLRGLGFRSTSTWWKCMPLLESKEDDPSIWFVDVILRKAWSNV